MFDIEKYYDNKAFGLPQNVQDTIIVYFERLQTVANACWKDHYAALQKCDGRKAESQLNRFKQKVSALQGAKNLLEEFGIYIEYDWVGHRRRWFFPDYADAEAQEDYLIQCAY